MIHHRLKSPLTATVAAVLLAARFEAAALPQPDTDWRISGPFGGTATTVAVDPHNPQTLLAGALDALLYRSDDAGQTWISLPFPPRHLGEITSALIDPTNSEHFFAGVLDAFGGALFESFDRGVTWKAVPDISDFGVRALGASASDPSQFVAGTLQGVMLTKDSGKTWHRISDLNNLEMRGITSVAIDPKNPEVIYAGTSHLPWKTIDGGKTWNSIHDGMIDDSDVFSIYIDPTNPSNVYASACSGIYTSANAGELWKKIAGIPNTSRRTHVIRLDPVQSHTIFAGTTTGLFESPNGGTSWRTLINTQVNSLAFDPNQPQTMYLAMLNAGLGKSSDGGQVIQPINEGFVDRYINSITHAGSELVAIEGQEGETTGIFTSTDAGATWMQLNNPAGLQGVHLRTVVGGSANERVLLAANATQVFKSEDGAATWKPLPLKVSYEETISVPVRKPARRGARPVTTQVTRTRRVSKTVTPDSVIGLWSVRLENKDLVYLSAKEGFFQTEDWGLSWTQVDLPGAFRVDALFAGTDPIAPILLKTSDAFLISRDRGAKWDSVTLPRPVGDVNDVSTTVDGSRILVATTVGLYLSADGGQTWTQNPSGVPASTVSSVVFATDQSAYCTGYGQLFKSDDAGQHWQLIPTRLSRLSIHQLWCPARGRLYAVTSGMGILFRD